MLYSSLAEALRPSLMFKFLSRNPVKKAKKHVEKALGELEDGYPDYASIEFEKAAKLFLEGEGPDFAVKYFREAASCALENNDHTRAALMKTEAAETLLTESTFDEAGGLYSEASDHFFRTKKARASGRAIALAILCHLSVRRFDTSMNVLRKAEKRFSNSEMKKMAELNLAGLFVRILFEGHSISSKDLEKELGKVKPQPVEVQLFEFLFRSIRLAIQTEIRVEWAGQELDEVNAKTPIEFEFRYKCPVPVKACDFKYTLSNSLIFSKEPKIGPDMNTEESWLFELMPVLSGGGIVGPFRLTLEGDEVHVHKVSNTIDFLITKAPADLRVEMTPQRISCGLGEDAFLDVILSNTGDGPAENIAIQIVLSEGIEISLGSDEKIIQFLGPNEKMRLQVYVRGISYGEELVTVKATDGRSGQEVITTSQINVG